MCLVFCYIFRARDSVWQTVDYTHLLLHYPEVSSFVMSVLNFYYYGSGFFKKSEFNM